MKVRDRLQKPQLLEFYRQMMLDAGMKDAAGDVFTGAMADALIISGSELS